MSVVKSIDEALDLLKGEKSETVDTIQETLELSTEEVDGDQMEKAVDFDLVKAEDDAEIQQLIQADGFMTALSQNQDYNTDKLVKGLTNNYRATEALLTVMKGLTQKLDRLDEVVSGIAGTPQPAKGALTREEAESLAKGEVAGAKGQKEAVTLTKSRILEILEKGRVSGEVSDSDLLKADSALSSYEEVSEKSLAILAPSAQNYLAEAIKQ